MNLARQIKQLFIILSISLLGTTQVMANALKIDIAGCLSVISSGSECGNNPATGADNTIFASGTFKLWDFMGVSAPGTLSSLPESKYFASTEVKAKSRTSGTEFFDNKNKLFDSKSELTTHPDWLPALTVFQTVVSGGPLASPGVLIAFAVQDITTIGDLTEGTFTAWSESTIDILNSEDDLNGLSQSLFKRDLPTAGNEIDFTASAQLSAIPEPVSLALLGLGVAAMASIRRKKD